ncbi:hypothetical protein [Tabrizicola sp.]|uniref:hypothetical protein n=1 Tax=Tabrizicola sp. TaxID=2005166 RepID=UPI003F33937D
MAEATCGGDPLAETHHVDGEIPMPMFRSNWGRSAGNAGPYSHWPETGFAATLRRKTRGTHPGFEAEQA